MRWSFRAWAALPLCHSPLSHAKMSKASVQLADPAFTTLDLACFSARGYTIFAGDSVRPLHKVTPTDPQYSTKRTSRPSSTSRTRPEASASACCGRTTAGGTGTSSSRTTSTRTTSPSLVFRGFVADTRRIASSIGPSERRFRSSSKPVRCQASARRLLNVRAVGSMVDRPLPRSEEAYEAFNHIAFRWPPPPSGPPES
jgi:hypothetical protein